MTTILMTSLKMLKSIPLDGLKTIIDKPTLLFTESDPEFKKVLIENNLFLEIKMYENYFSNNQVIQDIYQLHEKYHFNNIITLSEGDILRVAEIREILDIPGQRYHEAILFRDKIAMKKLAASFGVSVALPCKLSEFDPQQASYPVIVKPQAGRGSFQTYKVDSIEGFQTIDIENPYDYIVEPFIEGEIYHIDGLYLKGMSSLISPAKYVSNCLNFVNGTTLGSYTLTEQHPYYKKLKDFACYLLNSVYPMPDYSLFHIEVFVTKNGTLTLCEIACRIGGNDLLKEIEIAYGINVVLAYLDYCYHHQSSFNITDHPSKCGGRFLIPPKKGQLLKSFDAPNFQEIVSYSSNAQINKPYENMMMSNAEIVKIVLQAQDECLMVSLFDKLHLWQQSNILWGND